MAKQIKIEKCANGHVVTVIDLAGPPCPSPDWSPRNREYVFQSTSDMFMFIDGQINPIPCGVPSSNNAGIL